MLVIACGAIAKEIVSLKKLNHWDQLELICLPAIWHNFPERIPGAVEEKIQRAQAENKKVFVAFADCGTGGRLDRVLAKYQVERLPGAHCYAFFTGCEAFEQLHEEELGTMYLTDFLVRNFDYFIIKGLGIDRHPELQGMYFAHYKRLVYLAQFEDPALLEQAKAAAKRLDLEFHYRFTGMGELGSSLDKQAHHFLPNTHNNHQAQRSI